jgi:hypothetical protein
MGATADRVAAQAAATTALGRMPEQTAANYLRWYGPVSGWAIHTCRVICLDSQR